EWFVDEKYPDENATKVHFRPAAGDGYWQEVSLPANSKSGVRFPAGTANPVIVRVTAFDLAGNKTEATREIAAPGGNPQTSTSLSPTSPTLPAAPPGAPPGAPVPPARPGTGAIPPPDNLAASGLAPVPPVSPAGGGTPSPAPPIAPPAIGGSPLPTTDPRQPV